MSHHAPGRLLVVDDEVSLMVALRNTLQDEGYQVTGVSSGAEALAALRQTEFDLVLADLMMPAMDGIALIREALAAHPRLVAIIMTGHGSVATAVEAMKVGAIDYVLKPFKLNLLLPALERALTVRRLRAANAALEACVRERTAELEAANRDLAAFSFSVSHDLRMPLRTVAGFAEILIEHHDADLSAEVRRLVGQIQIGAEEMTAMINGLHALSLLGQEVLKLESFDLGRLVRDVFQELKREHPGRRVELRLPAPLQACGDRVLLRQVVANLLSNAFKYTRSRHPAVIEVGVTAVAGESTPVHFVRDNGVGFDPRHAGKLFGMFQRLHRSSEFEGTGVGLATAHRIIERHGGRIWAEAVPGTGATFFFTLPDHPVASLVPPISETAGPGRPQGASPSVVKDA